MTRCRSQLVPAICALGLLLVVSVLAGCRTPVAVEGDLSAEPFLSSQASLTKDPGGNWYAVAAEGQALAPLAIVESDEETHLFATRPVGRRAAQLFPLSQAGLQWFNDAMGGQPTLRFIKDATDQRLSSSVGRWEGGDREAIEWLGDGPNGPVRAVVVPEDFEFGSLSLADHILGTIDAGPDGLIERHGRFAPHRGPYLVLPDGPLPEESQAAGPIVVTYTDLGIDESGWSHWRFEELQGPNAPNHATARQLASQSGADVLIADDGDGALRVGFAADAAFPVVGAWQRPVSLVDSGFLIAADADEEALVSVLDAIDALYADYPLSAAYSLRKADAAWSVDHNERATTLRHHDLVGAGGYAAWTRAAIIEDQEGMGADSSLFLARAYGAEGFWRAATRHGERSLQYFAQWPRPAGALGAGQARQVLAAIEKAQGNQEQALEQVLTAADEFLRAEDNYRADRATALAYQWGWAGDIMNVVDSLEGQGAHADASRTLLLAAAKALNEPVDRELGERYLKNWTDRFADDAGPRELLLMWALDERWRAIGGGQTDPDQARRKLDEAMDIHAWDAVLVLTLTAYSQRAHNPDHELIAQGQLLNRALQRSDSESIDAAVHSVLGRLCADLVFSLQQDDPARQLSDDCEERAHDLLNSRQGLLTLIDVGHAFVQRGELGAAEDLHDFVFDELRLDHDNPRVFTSAGAQLMFFSAILQEEQYSTYADRDATDHVVRLIQAGFDGLREELDATEAPSVLLGWADEFKARGAPRLQLALLRAARDAAEQARGSSEIFSATLALAEALYRAEKWGELADLESPDSPLHAARIDLYRGHAEFVRENRGRSRQLTEDALARAAEFGDFQRIAISHLAGELAVARRDFEAAKDYVQRAQSIIDALPESLANREERAVLEARVLAIGAHVAAGTGDFDDAARQARQARQIFAELPHGTAPHVRREVLDAAATYAIDHATFSQILTDLESSFSRLPQGNEAGQMTQRAETGQTLIHWLRYDAADEQAAHLLRVLLDDGLPMGSERTQHHCEAGPVRLLAGEEEPAIFHLERCAETGDAVQAARAQLLLAMNDDDATAEFRVGLVQHLRERLPGYATAEQTRLDWMIQWAAPGADSPRAGQILRSTYEQARDDVTMDAEARIAATADYVEWLIAQGEYGDADEILRSQSAIFEEPSGSGLVQWHLLRRRSLLRQLRPHRFFDYVEQADVDRRPAAPQMATDAYQRAVAHFQLGQHLRALQALDQARQEVAADSDLGQAIDARESTVAASRFDH